MQANPQSLKKPYWQLTALLLAAHFGGWRFGLPLAMALTLWQSLHFACTRHSFTAFEVQVRVGYLALLLAGTLPGLWPVHVVQFVGVNAMLLFNYCLLARLLALAPWNCQVPWSGALVRRVLLSSPLDGSVLAWVQPRGHQVPPC